MKTKIGLIIIGILFCSIVNAQSVSVYGGGSILQTAIYGVEFRTNKCGVFIERYYSDKDIPARMYDGSLPVYEKYDGIMVGMNFHIKAMSDVVLSGGVGILNQYKYDFDYHNNITKEVIQNVAFEFMMGKDIIVKDHLVLGVKGGVNTCTLIVGTFSVGYKF